MKSRIGKTITSGGEEYLTCEEVITFLLDYLSLEVGPEERRDFERHLANCPSCAAYLATYQQAVELGREALRRDLETDPRPLDCELVQAILLFKARG
jgi:anti-sigma factor RsiW